jgi:methanogenic corrinoid protein MtbC1
MASHGVPRILLTTLPQERHGLGLLMAEAMCVAEGAHCISLGVQTPLIDIVEAARPSASTSSPCRSRSP